MDVKALRAWYAFRTALRLSPFDPFRYAPFAALGAAYFLQGRFEEAAEAFRRAIESNSRFSSLHAWLASTLVQLDRIEEAKAAARHVLTLLPTYSMAAVVAEYSAGGDRFALFFDSLRMAGLPE